MSAGGEAAVDAAQNFSGGLVAAARKRERWLQLSVNAGDSETREQYREAAADLEARYPDLEDVGPGEAESFARTRGYGKGSRSPVHDGRMRQRPGSRKQTKKPSPAKPPAKSRAGGTRSKRARGGSRQVGRPTPRVDRAIEQTGIPSAARGGGSAALALLGLTVSLSLLYLVFHSAEVPGAGAKAVPTIVQAVVRAVGRFISLADVFPAAPGVPVEAGAGSAAAAGTNPSRQGNRGVPGALAVPLTPKAQGNRGVPGATVVPYQPRKR